jgi:hypothetical protein
MGFGSDGRKRCGEVSDLDPNPSSCIRQLAYVSCRTRLVCIIPCHPMTPINGGCKRKTLLQERFYWGVGGKCPLYSSRKAAGSKGLGQAEIS